MDKALRVLITGAAGKIGYSLAPMLASGDVFGKTPVTLVLHDIPAVENKLSGLKMELEDCASPYLHGVEIAFEEKQAFSDIDYAFLVGAKPRMEGMERKQLLAENVAIFKQQGLALANHAKPDVRVLVVGNPANTNAMICAKYASTGKIPVENISAMTRLDHNRSVAQVASKMGVPASDIKKVTVWGNHSSTMFPDIRYSTVIKDGKRMELYPAIGDEEWVRNEFINIVRRRGGDVISRLGHSSALSAAKAACDHMHDWHCGTRPGDWTSMVVISSGLYGTKRGVFFSFPVTVDPKTRKWSIVEGLQLDDFAKEQIRATNSELVEERDEALDVCNRD